MGAAFGKLGERLADLPGGDLTSIAIWRRRLWSDEQLKAHLSNEKIALYAEEIAATILAG